jgi:hypothetical protein
MHQFAAITAHSQPKFTSCHSHLSHLQEVVACEEVAHQADEDGPREVSLARDAANVVATCAASCKAHPAFQLKQGCSLKQSSSWQPGNETTRLMMPRWLFGRLVVHVLLAVCNIHCWKL